MSQMSRWLTVDAEFRDQLQRWANTQRLEGNYVAAQTTEQMLAKLQLPKPATQPFSRL